MSYKTWKVNKYDSKGKTNIIYLEKDVGPTLELFVHLIISINYLTKFLFQKCGSFNQRIKRKLREGVKSK